MALDGPEDALLARRRGQGVRSRCAEALRSKPPYPPSPVIRGVPFAPESTIVRKAIDSDNWPITWGDDDDQYTVVR